MSFIGDLIGKGNMEYTEENNEDEVRLAQQQASEKQRIAQKQIRALRNRYRPGGGLLGANPRGVDVMTSTGLPTKFGTT